MCKESRSKKDELKEKKDRGKFEDGDVKESSWSKDVRKSYASQMILDGDCTFNLRSIIQ